MEEILRMEGITKEYGKVVANREVSIHLHKGEVLAIVGENGAGKSTLMKILYGLEHADSGSISVYGQPAKFHSPSDAMQKGIGMVQQHFMLFGSMTVAENIVYNNELRRGIFYDKKANEKRVSELSSQYQLNVDPAAIVEDCPVGAQQRVEIMKTLYQNADILIFDEPTAVLTPVEVGELLQTLKKLAEMGKSIIIITHKLNEVMEVSDRVVVMRDGSVVAEFATCDTSIEQLSYHMVGRHLEMPEIEPPKLRGEMLSIEGLTLAEGEGRMVLKGIDLSVRRGEIVGVAGVSGNGQTELVRCLTGLEKGWMGKMTLDGQPLKGKDVAGFRKAGVAHIPEDRYAWGSAREATLAENALMANQYSAPFSRHGVLNLKTVQHYTADLIMEYGVKAASVFQKIRELSGGNAQKLIAAREIGMETSFLVASEPTRGIDLGAIEFIHNKLLEKRDKGDAILLVSSELSEIMKLSDRIYVLYEGTIGGVFQRGEASEQQLGLLMVGGKPNEH